MPRGVLPAKQLGESCNAVERSLGINLKDGRRQDTGLVVRERGRERERERVGDSAGERSARGKERLCEKSEIKREREGGERSTPYTKPRSERAVAGSRTGRGC